MPMALSSDSFLVPQARIRGFKCGNFTDWCKIGSEKMWAQAFIADIQHVRCCNSIVETGPKGLDQRVLTNGVFR